MRHGWAGRIVGLGLAVAVTTVACGDDGDDGGSAGRPGDEAAGEGVRAVDHHQGTTEVPIDPQRVVVLDTPQLDAMAALGVTPVGSTTTDVSDEFPEWLDGLDDVEAVGTIQEPNLEAIAALEPDLILSSTFRHEEHYDMLSEIAPTVFVEDVSGSWKENFLAFADAVNRRDDAELMLEEYEERAAELGGRLGEDTTVGIVRFLPDETRIYGPESFSGSILVDMGVPLPGAVADLTGDIALYPSAEEISLVEDADLIFTTVYGDPDEATVDEVAGGPIWPNLPAVAAGDVHDVSDDVWMLGIGMVGANAILDDIEAAVG
jgi:iron complex transport system substrate-binding protein